MKPINIQKCNIEDLISLQTISIKTFHDTFAEFNTREDMDNYLEETFNKNQLAAELQDPDTAFYLAKSGEETIGYLKLGLNNQRVELAGKSIEIERVYIDQSHLGKSIGQQLLNKAIAVAHESNCEFIWLGVWENNPRAIRFYEKNGFTTFGTHPFKLGNDLQTDFLMKLKL